MSNIIEDYEPAPIEYFHGRIMDYFHEWRLQATTRTEIEINGSVLNNIIAKAKNDTLNKYYKLNVSKPILRSKL